MWMEDLEARHLADLTFSEVSRSLRALSSTYVERRGKIAQGAALSGTGKRAAFALFYGPLHFLLLRHILESVTGAAPRRPVVDLGCGTGSAGAACAAAWGPGLEVLGIDRHPWAIDEARRAYKAFDARGRTRVDDLSRVSLPANALAVAAFAVNELPEDRRLALLPRLLAHAAAGGAVLILEPLAGFVAPWWPEWQRAFEAQGGQAHEWRARLPLPPLVVKLDRAAGLDHGESRGRTLSVNVKLRSEK